MIYECVKKIKLERARQLLRRIADNDQNATDPPPLDIFDAGRYAQLCLDLLTEDQTPAAYPINCACWRQLHQLAREMKTTHMPVEVLSNTLAGILNASLM